MLGVMTYGERFRELRELLGLEQPDLAERLFGDRERHGTSTRARTCDSGCGDG